jgi:uncharacterized repeat protein (TIGR01451 family)
MRAGRLIAAATALALAAIPSAFAVGTPAGTVISNQATVTYTDTNGNPLSALSNVVSTTVSQVASVTVAPDNASSAAPGDVVTYAHQVTNGGNGPDTLEITAASSNGWATALFMDNNGDGLLDAGDTPLADSDGDGAADAGLMAADAVVNILAQVTVPAGAASGMVDVMTVTATSSFDPAVSDSAADTTTVLAPSLSVVKSVAPLGAQPPGAVLTYTMVVTNGGNADASAVVLTDPVPANTTFFAGSITLNGAGQTDAGGDDAGDHNATTPGAVTVSVGLLAPGASATITFQVTIN